MAGESEGTLRRTCKHFFKHPLANTSLTKASEDGNATEKVEVLPIVNFGGAGGTRTPYLFNAIEALSQMSYSPTRNRGEPD